MRIQPVVSNNQNLSFNGYRNLSDNILKSDRKGLINLAEYFHNAAESELKEITNSNPKALNRLVDAIEGVITRKKCYIADGSAFAKKKAEELDTKAAHRQELFAIA